MLEIDNDNDKDNNLSGKGPHNSTSAGPYFLKNQPFPEDKIILVHVGKEMLISMTLSSVLNASRTWQGNLKEPNEEVSRRKTAVLNAS